MKVFDLSCEHDHRFEGWFASSEAFDQQLGRHLIECPVCASHDIRKLLAAPRLNLSSAKPTRAEQDRAGQAVATQAAPDAGGNGRPPDPARMQAEVLQRIRQIMAATEDVGDRFAEEARRIHYNETPERAIRGQATVEEAVSLQDEGIDVFALPLPNALKQRLQ